MRITDGTIDMQGTWDSHQLFEFGPNGLNVDENGESKGSNFIRIAHNDHRWYGALSNFSMVLSDEWTFSAGIDARHYTGAITERLEICLGPITTMLRMTEGIKIRILKHHYGPETSTTITTTARYVWGIVLPV